jgi:hypothetical protein
MLAATEDRMEQQSAAGVVFLLALFLVVAVNRPAKPPIIS